ncbi:MAG: gamma-glutamyl-gamma-aminobutyrate hydrolase family protein [Actinobacteria bacterium]|nr:gamma-glutamyl-gamma-aminobutyrate hydrolase family protein [Actinomycetota bacterium]
MKPLIGVTAGHRDVHSPGGDEHAHVLYTAYTSRVREAGGLPVVLAAGPPGEVPSLLERLDGVVMTGGGDLDPAHYGGSPHEKLYGVDPDRDEFELALASVIAERRMPLLAICRGMQVLNVAFGGTLYEDIADQRPDAIPHRVEGGDAYRGIQEVTVVDGSTTAQALGTNVLKVNSVHHQGIRDLAPAFRATATTSDGIVEAYEPLDGAWPLLAVQWHPEWLPGEAPARRLFEALVAAAG